MIVALVSVDIAVVNRDLLLEREAHIILWNAVARGIIGGARLLRKSVLYTAQFSRLNQNHTCNTHELLNQPNFL